MSPLQNYQHKCESECTVEATHPDNARRPWVINSRGGTAGGGRCSALACTAQRVPHCSKMQRVYCMCGSDLLAFVVARSFAGAAGKRWGARVGCTLCRPAHCSAACSRDGPKLMHHTSVWTTPIKARVDQRGRTGRSQREGSWLLTTQTCPALRSTSAPARVALGASQSS